MSLIDPQPAPIPNDNPSVWQLVLEDVLELEPVDDLIRADMLAREAFGKEKYGTVLQAGNGRNFLADAYQERLDLVVYLRGALEELYAKSKAGTLTDGEAAHHRRVRDLYYAEMDGLRAHRKLLPVT